MAYFSTADVDVADRADYWRHIMSEAVLPLDAVPSATDPAGGGFDGGIEFGDVGDLSVSTLNSVGQRVRRTRRLIAARDEGTYCLCLLVNGSIRLAHGDRREILTPGDVTVLDSSEEVQFEVTGQHKVIGLQLPRRHLAVPRKDVLSLIGSRLTTRSGAGAFLRPFLTELARQVHRAELTSTQRWERMAADLTGSLLLERLDKAGQESARPRRVLLSQIRRDIETRIGSPELSADDLAARHRITVRRLDGLFRAEGVGAGVEDWIRERRLERSRRSLLDKALDGLPVSLVASQCGFPNSVEFERLFTMRYGVSPGEYRRRRLNSI